MILHHLSAVLCISAVSAVKQNTSQSTSGTLSNIVRRALGLAAALHATSLGAGEPRFSFAEQLLAPVRVHLLAAPDEPAFTTSLTGVDIERILGEVNGVWAQAGLCFYVESIRREPPAAAERRGEPQTDPLSFLLGRIPAGSYRADVFNIYYVKELAVNGVYFPKAIFVKDTASLRPVEGGIDEPLPRVTSHELGHALGLPHRQETFNLMASGTTGTILNATEIELARRSAAHSGRFLSAPKLLAEAEDLQRAGKAEEAQVLHRRLAALKRADAPPGE